MKRITSPAFVLVLAISVLLIGATQTASAREHYYPNGSVYAPGAADGGRLLIRYSPTLGINVGLVVRIDGREAGAFTKGHIYKRYLPPGRHEISVYRNGRGWDAWHMTLDVHRGQTYSYVAKHNSYKVLLVPVGGYQ